MFTTRRGSWMRETRLFKRERVNYSRESARNKLINYLRRELPSSTTHGLPHLVSADTHWFERLLWALCLLFCLVLVSHMVYVQNARFIETPTVIIVEKDYFNWNVSYPAFTLCPSYRPDAVAYPELVNITSARAGRDMEGYMWALLCASMETLPSLDLDLEGPDMISLIDPREYATLAVRGFRKFDDDPVTTNTNWTVSVDVIITEMGVCYAINSNVAQYDRPEFWRSNVSPLYRKRNIELSIYDSDFFTQISFFGAYQLFLHSPDEAALPTSPSYTPSDRGIISIGVNPVSSRISETLRNSSIQLRKCRFVHEPISKRYPIYSYNHCLLECRINMIKTICGCLPHFYKPIDGERICNMAELKCLVEHNKEIMYLSTSGKTLKQRGYSTSLPRSSSDCACLSMCETDTYLKDYASFERGDGRIDRTRVKLSSFPKVRVVRDVIFSYGDVLLKTVGVINVCFGSSILSIVEILIIAIKFIVLSLTKR